MRNMRSSLMLAALIAVCLFTVPAAGGADPLATVNVGAQGIHWQAAGDFEKITLTVAGPDGLVLRREFAAGTSPVFEPFVNGKPLADGSYTWEMTAAPRLDRETKRALAAARRAGDEAAITSLREAGKLPRTPLTQSGAFTISNGSIVSPDLREDVPTKDQVIPDDLIVQGSGCFGFDCVNNENFGFDTIRLKENNLRIKFEDTSVGTFPTNDWQLTANDSASGGSSKFSIEDITGSRVPFTITAGAATNSIFVDSTGRLGLRTSTPVLDLHINTSNTPAIRLEQNNSGGFTAQTWDIAGNEANFFVRDVTGGSRLSFRIRPGAPTSSIDIASDGEVGIGTASPVAELTVKSDAGNSDAFVVQGSDISSPTLFRIFETTAGDGLFSVFNELGQEAARFTAVSGGRFAVGCNAPEHDLDLGNSPGTACNAVGSRSFIDAGSTTFTASSSRFIKENLKPLEVPNILDKISQVGVYNYDFIDGPKDKIGVMAEDFHTIFGRGSDKLLNGQDVEMALWLAVQELTTRNTQLADQNSELVKRLERLEALLGAKQ